jgi:hypothetical protein
MQSWFKIFVELVELTKDQAIHKFIVLEVMGMVKVRETHLT